MHEKRFNLEIDRLRDPDRVARLEVSQVVDLALAGMQKPSNVLDVGSGTGLFAGEFASRGLRVTGLDVNSEMLSTARELVPSAQFRQGSAEKLPFTDSSFDLVFMGLVLHETDDSQAALDEARRVTRKRLAILEWPDKDQPIGPPREHRLSFATVNALAHASGFQLVTDNRLENLVLYLLGF